MSADRELRERVESLQSELAKARAERDEAVAAHTALHQEHERLKGAPAGADAFAHATTERGLGRRRLVQAFYATALAAAAAGHVLLDAPLTLWSVGLGLLGLIALTGKVRVEQCRVEPDELTLTTADARRIIRYADLQSATVERRFWAGRVLTLRTKQGETLSLPGLPQLDALAEWISKRIQATALPSGPVQPIEGAQDVAPSPKYQTR